MKDIRDYIRAELRKVDGMLAEHEVEMKFEDLPASKVDNRYRIVFGNFDTTIESTYFQDESQIELMLYRKIDKRIPATYDRCVDLAKKVRSALVHPKNWLNTTISAVNPSGFSVTEYQGNSDIYEIKLNLTFTVSNSL